MGVLDDQGRKSVEDGASASHGVRAEHLERKIVEGARDGLVSTRSNGPRMQAEEKKAKPSQWARAKFDGRLARALQSLANCC